MTLATAARLSTTCLFRRQCLRAGALSSSRAGRRAYSTPVNHNADDRFERADFKMAPKASLSKEELAHFQSQLLFPRATHRASAITIDLAGQTVRVYGYLSPAHKLNKKLAFSKIADYADPDVTPINIVSHIGEDSDKALVAAHEALLKISPAVPMVLEAEVVTAHPKEGEEEARPELKLKSLYQLNDVDPSLIITKETVFSPVDRHLQLRYTPTLLSALQARAKIARICRSELEDAGFLEVETPLLFKSTPEGAREFLVPTRDPGVCYALPQSPQQYKQILMASGVERYYQIAKCFRDEDLRADRQPEFTQLDLEMAFANKEDVMRTMENVVKRIWKEVKGVQVGKIPVWKYQDAMDLYGSDKPDLRYAEIKIERAEGQEDKEIVEEVLRYPIPEGVKAKKFAKAVENLQPIKEIKSAHGKPVFQTVSYTNTLDITLSRPRTNTGGSHPLGDIRRALLQHLPPYPPRTPFAFAWITDFPLFTPSTETGDLQSTHHPFTAPVAADAPLLSTLTTASQVRGAHYDLVVNGVELGGGSVRIHNAALQRKVFELLGLRTVSFEHLLRVLDSGAPPHAGMALGFDRLCAVVLGRQSVRDVIAFPKGFGGDALVGSPGLCEEGLRTYGLQVVPLTTEEVMQ